MVLVGAGNLHVTRPRYGRKGTRYPFAISALRLFSRPGEENGNVTLACQEHGFLRPRIVIRNLDGVGVVLPHVLLQACTERLATPQGLEAGEPVLALLVGAGEGVDKMVGT